ncbi:uncharacterized protein LOC131848718 [Achroia grisella]|uniref:uncharacterized protein LOC131848718 n=1 Tax=Achroia grisella TaxID=688607 RepID=UPI0027D222DB|nr:uncharacterized protein LOC131848718 [Achroia grisella]
MLNLSKRKKRKTRKCLDELRKRSQHCLTTSNKTVSTVQIGNKIMFSRFSLSIFPNIIRSNPVTRFNIQSESSSRKNQSNCITRITQKCSPEVTYATTFDNDITNVSVNNILNKTFVPCNKRGEIGIEKIIEDNSPENNILFNPLEVNMDEETFDDTTTSTEVCFSPGSIRNNYYDLYEKIMKDISIYLRNNAPRLFEEDVMASTKSYCRSLYKHSINKWEYGFCEERISNIEYSKVSYKARNTLVENPIEYLTYGNMRRQNVLTKFRMSDSTTIEVPNSPSSPFASGVQTKSVLHTTPDYNFFPHKLN